MGSKAGWADVLSLGGASAQRKAANAQADAAREQARIAEEQARLQLQQQLAPVQVQATQLEEQRADEVVDTANKRKRTLSKTASQGASSSAANRYLGGGASYLG